MVDIISVSAGRRLMAPPRLLSAGTVFVDYRLVIPASNATAANFTVDSVLKSQDAMQVGIDSALEGLTAERIDISSVVALEPTLVLGSVDEALSAQTANSTNGSSFLLTSNIDTPSPSMEVDSGQMGAASAAVLACVLVTVLLVSGIMVLVARHKGFCGQRKTLMAAAAEGPTPPHLEEGDVDVEQGGEDSAGDVAKAVPGKKDDEEAAEQAENVPGLQAELSGVVVSLADDDIIGGMPLQNTEAGGQAEASMDPPRERSMTAPLDELPEDDIPFMPASKTAEPLATWRGFFQHVHDEEQAPRDAPLGPRDGMLCNPEDPGNAL